MKKRITLLAALAVALIISSCAPMPESARIAPAAAPCGPGDDHLAAGSHRAPIQRPGLATGWGDSKKSKLRVVSYQRASSRPAGTDAIYYNDSDGVHAMADAKKKVSAMQPAAGGLVEWGIKGRHGYLKTYESYTHGKRFVMGSKGSSYSIVVKNKSRSTLEIVCSVDGLDVMDGKTAKYAKRGYLVAPGKTLTIDGFRTSLNSVSKFQFSGVSSSYANLKHGDTRNVGVIGMAVFTQKGVYAWGPSSHDEELRAAASPFATAP